MKLDWNDEGSLIIWRDQKVDNLLNAACKVGKLKDPSPKD